MKIEFVELKERHILAFSSAMPKDAGELRVPVYQNAIVKAAITAGWLVSPVLKPEDVDEMKHKEVVELFRAVTELYAKENEISPS
jgi:hypothetical protein